MSQDLVQSLTRGQESILLTLSELQGISRSYLQAKPKLRVLREQILNYFGRQDQALMDRLFAQNMENREKIKLLEFLDHDIKAIKIKFLIFSEQYSGDTGDHGRPAFPKDFQEFTREMVARFKIEEEYLFPFLQELPVS